MTLFNTSQRGITGLSSGLLVALALAGTQTNTLAQGCVAVRGSSACMLHPHDGFSPEDANLMGGDWIASVSERYLHSHRHFVGDVEQTQRQITQANEVINHSHFIDLGLQYAFSPRYSAALALPLVFSDRSQKAPTGYPTYRYETHASGIGDARLTGYVWLWDPAKMPKGNLQFGLGLKAPTGDDNVQDAFPTVIGGVITPVLKSVDQSIQPGDGGWGFSVEMNAYREILPRTEVFLQASYLFNPANQNGSLTWRDNNTTTPGVVSIANNIPNGINGPADYAKAPGFYEHFMSVPDQYFARGGFSYTLVPKWGLSVSLAGRLEGVPVEDLLGGSDGFRRPGFAVSIDPGIQVTKGRYTFNLNVPFALYRNRERSLADQQAAAYRQAHIAPGQVNNDVHGDAAFADYVVTASLSVRF